VAGWTKVSTVNSQDHTITLSEQVNPVPDHVLNGWNLGDNTMANSATWFAIVVSTKQQPTGTAAYFRSVSLCAGDIATIPAPQTQDEVLRECQYYYEKSYDSAIAPGAVSSLGQVFIEQYANGVPGGPDTVSLKSRAFIIQFNTPKFNATPTITLLSPTTGTSDKVRGYTRNAATALADADITFSSNWTSGYDGEKFHAFIPSNVSDLIGPTNTAGNSFPEAYILFHFVADCRLGV
jgi:hypothetical protein